MELFILIISVPLFLLVVLVISVFVLANYSGNEPAKSAPPAESAPGAQSSAPAESAPGAQSSFPAEQRPGADSALTTIVGWGLTFLMYAAFAVAIGSKLKLNKEK